MVDEETGVCLADAEDTETANVSGAPDSAAGSVSEAENAKVVLKRVTVINNPAFHVILRLERRESQECETSSHEAQLRIADVNSSQAFDCNIRFGIPRDSPVRQA